MEFIGYLAVGSLLIFTVWFFFFRKSAGDSSSNTQSQSTSTSTTRNRATIDPLQDLDQRLENLISLNLRLRKSGVTSDVLEDVEGFIDSLSTLLQAIVQRGVGGSLAQQAHRIEQEFLPETLNSFLRLSPEQQEASKANLLTVLGHFSGAISKALQAVESGDQSEFDVQAAFIDAKFSGV